MNPKVLFSGATSWYLNHTARECQKFGNLSGYWMANAIARGVPEEKYKRIWPYHLAQKAFYHLPFRDLEERMRWHNLPFYDAWISRQKIPDDTNVVQAPMGSCEAIFKLADSSGRRILKVFDAPNSHPTTLSGYWQRECDLFCPGYRIPIPPGVFSKFNREVHAADIILCPSLFVRDSMISNGVPETKCFVSHFGVDTSVFQKRESLPDKARFISVGSLTVRKGQQYLFRAFEKVKTMLPDVELVFVGGTRPDFREELKRWHGTFTYYPGLNQEELAGLLRTSTAFVLNSLEEGFARVLSEAMACGLPIIASYESGATTVVTNEVEGIIVKPTDIDGIARAMIRMATQHEENARMGEAAFLAGGKANTWADYTRRLLNEYSRRLDEIATQPS